MRSSKRKQSPSTITIFNCQVISIPDNDLLRRLAADRTVLCCAIAMWFS